MPYLEILVTPILAMMGLGFVYSAILRTFHNSQWSTVAFGALFGVAIVLTMTFPIALGSGFIVDLRGLLIGLCVVFTGWIAGLLALAMGVVYRIYIGGGGMLTGVIALVSAYVLGLIWRNYLGPRMPQGTLSDVAFGGLMSLTLLTLFLLPYEIALKVTRDLAVPITLANMLGAVVLSFVFRRETKYFRDAEQLRIYASIDPLTNLLNRRGTADRLARLKPSSDSGCVLLYFDIDHFKHINDSHGHAAGDVVLATVAERIEGCVRDQVIFSRHGGDEFTLFIPNISRNAVQFITERIRHAVSESAVHFNDKMIPVTISIGAYWTKDVASFDVMLAAADQQLMRAKAQGRNRSCIAIEDEVPPVETAPPPLAAAVGR